MSPSPSLSPAHDPEIAARMLAVGVAVQTGSDLVVVVSIRRWFGDAWLGFKGKLIGALGVRTDLQRDLSLLKVPPFHPNRVIKTTALARCAGEWVPATAPRLHEDRTSETNTRITLTGLVGAGVVVVWWSVDDEHRPTRMSLMIARTGEPNDAAYVEHTLGEQGWSPTRVVSPPGGELGAVFAPIRPRGSLGPAE